jgi:hypothetical protein
MPCQWLHLASLTTEEHLCGKPGNPYCEEHQREMDYIHSLDDDWKETEASRKPICEDPKENKGRKR